jgi:hypothetical protein
VNDRLRALGGIAGPAAFVTAWAVLGVHARRAGYSPVHDPISRLAAVGAPTRAAMTAGFVGFTAGVLPAASVFRRTHSHATGTAAATAAVATAAVGLAPLGASFGDGPHALAAGTAYAALAATPLAGGVAHWRAGRRRAALVSFAAAVVTGVCLAISATSPPRVGLWQRLGLLAGDAWIVAESYRRARTSARHSAATGAPASSKSG